jgi:hypothetical protein
MSSGAAVEPFKLAQAFLMLREMGFTGQSRFKKLFHL